MCSIGGFVGRPPKKYEEVFQVFMDALLIESQVRGEHATGIAAFLGGTKSILGKGPVNAVNFIKVPVWKKGLEAKSMIAHCRYATHGSPGKNENNHPFESGRWAMIHNGVISDYREIARREKVQLTSECDSEIILRVFAKYVGKDQDARKGLQGWVDAVGGRFYGRYAVAVLDRSNGCIRLLRNEGSPCSILRLPRLGVVVFASTKEILSNAFDAAFKRFPDTDWGADAEQWDCIRDRIYVLRPETLEVEHEEVKIPEIDYRPEVMRQENIGFRQSRGTMTGVWRETTPGNFMTGQTKFLCHSCGQPDCECDNPRAFSHEA